MSSDLHKCALLNRCACTQNKQINKSKYDCLKHKGQERLETQNINKLKKKKGLSGGKYLCQKLGNEGDFYQAISFSLELINSGPRALLKSPNERKKVNTVLVHFHKTEWLGH